MVMDGDLHFITTDPPRWGFTTSRPTRRDGRLRGPHATFAQMKAADHPKQAAGLLIGGSNLDTAKQKYT